MCGPIYHNYLVLGNSKITKFITKVEYITIFIGMSMRIKGKMELHKCQLTCCCAAGFASFWQ